ncbi:hypothetical protein A1Q2_06851 [Trichosporon asahii var. asahii CBS 8904]|uniref:Zn(2)-C6 fungal-type domain-containing protein n=1 Tax=Trichosporon asahii var. asahii (strain CBS 8904) TaxID=1220162 RepID=K1VDF8_TRIAC|nr:hypothetical protein A1Q2_06851 [Trichosporon asahii var. asahii CBS 8904]
MQQPVSCNTGKWVEKSHNKDKEGPVKSACLSCRTKKAKCDGGRPVCGQCIRKNLECIYIKSKRGGARKKKVPGQPPPLVEFLKKLDELIVPPKFTLPHPGPQSGEDASNRVRVFESREEILRCYYSEIHPYLPMLPPRHYLVDVLPELLPVSPLLMATQTILTLAPHPLDRDPRDPLSKRLRSAASAQIGKETLDLIDYKLSRGEHSIENVQALIMLSVWEWGSTNNSDIAMARITRAIQVAYLMGLNEIDKPYGERGSLEGINWRRDMLRRTWWCLYVFQISNAMVSGQAPPIMSTEKVHVDFPVCSDKDRTWATWVNCIRQCLNICMMVRQMAMSPNQGDGQKMINLDRHVIELIKEAERGSKIQHVPGGEEDVAKNQQINTGLALAVTHIQIHRLQAFPEVSLFSKKICGFPQPAEQSDDEDDSYGMQSSASQPSNSAVNSPEPKVESASPQSQSQPLTQQSLMQQQQQMMVAQDGAPQQAGFPSFNQPPTNLAQWAHQAQQTAFIQPRQQQTNAQQQPFQTPPPQQQQRQQFQSPQGLQQQQQQQQFQAPQQTLQNFATNGMMNRPPIDLHKPLPPLPGQMAPAQQPPPRGSSMMNVSNPAQLRQQPQQPVDPMVQLGASGFDVSNMDFSAMYPAAEAFDSQLMQQWNYELQRWDGMTDDMWVPDAYPSSLPKPWFAEDGGAANMISQAREGGAFVPIPDFQPMPQQQFGQPQNNAQQVSNNTTPYHSDTPNDSKLNGQDGTVATGKKHKAWGVNEEGEVVANDDVKRAEMATAFPPGISLARCAMAAHAIVRLQVLHRSAALAMDAGVPRWLPFCSCGLVSGAYAFLLLVLAVQAETAFGDTDNREEEIESLLTNVQILAAGLEAYGVMWDGIDMMAREVKAAVDAAKRLPLELQSQRSQSSGPPGDTPQAVTLPIPPEQPIMQQQAPQLQPIQQPPFGHPSQPGQPNLAQQMQQMGMH